MPPKQPTKIKNEESPKKKSNHLSEVLNAVTQKTPCEYNPKEVSAYVLSLFLSEDKELCDTVNKINKFHFSLDDRIIFKYYVGKVPRGYRKIKFTQKTKESEERDKEVKKLMEEYGISKREARLSL